jgi:hypothetical protein
MAVVVMTGTELTTDEADLCERQKFSVLRKPYVPEDAVRLVRASLARASEAGR